MELLQLINLTSCNTSVCANGDDLGIGSGPVNSSTLKTGHAIYGSEVKIKVNSTSHTSGSSAIATRDITKYPWELVYIPGTLVAVHCSGTFIAYALKAPSTPNGIVRIISRKTGLRGLIKNPTGLIKDLSFAYLTMRILLAYIDHKGTLFVYEVTEEEKALRIQLLTEVQRNRRQCEEISDYGRVIWCPLIPDDTQSEDEDDSCDEENFAYLLAVTYGSVVEILYLQSLITQTGKESVGAVVGSESPPGPHHTVEMHSGPITDAAFSPDGTALATASLDGYVKFFQISMATSQPPRCIHQWKPHGGKPLSCLFFLDDHKNPSPEVQFWKFAVTGACNNTELKTWSCESWECTQTLMFEMETGGPQHRDGVSSTSPTTQALPLDGAKSPASCTSAQNGIRTATPSTTSLSLKAAIDSSSKYMVLSDIYRRVLYVLVLSQEQVGSGCASEGSNQTSTNQGDSVSDEPQGAGAAQVTRARIVSLAELPVQYPAMFLAVTDAGWKPYKRWKQDARGGPLRVPGSLYMEEEERLEGYEEDDEDDEDTMNVVEGLVVKCVLMNTKSLQDATIRFQPELPRTSSLVKSVGGCLGPEVPGASALTLSGTRASNLSISDDSMILKDGLTDLSLNLNTSSSEMDCRMVACTLPPPHSSNSSSPASRITSLSGGLIDHQSSILVGSSLMDRDVHTLSGVVASSSPSATSVGVLGAFPVLSSPTVSNSGVDCPAVTTLNLLTPESFSSPGKIDEETLAKSEANEIPKQDTPISLNMFPNAVPPSEDLKSAAISLLLRVNSSSGGDGSPTTSIVTPQSTPKSVLDTVVSGSSKRASPVDPLPQQAKRSSSASSISGQVDEAPLATSEGAFASVESSTKSSSGSVQAQVGVKPSGVPHSGSGVGLASSTSSPSLEVQQILHSHNGGKHEEEYDESGEKEWLEGGSKMSLTSGHVVEGEREKSTSSCQQTLQELINISASSAKAESRQQQQQQQQQTQQQKAVSNSQPPLLDMFPNLKSLSSGSPLTRGVVLTAAPAPTSSSCTDAGGGGLPAPSATAVLAPFKEPSRTGSNALPPLLKSISAGKSHLTCEELEAEIKCSSPAGPKRAVPPTAAPRDSVTPPSSSTAASSYSLKRVPSSGHSPVTPPLPPSSSSSNLVFPLNLGEQATSLGGFPKEGKVASSDHSDELARIRYEKILEEMVSLREEVLSCHRKTEERTEALTRRVDQSLGLVEQVAKAVEEMQRTQARLQDRIPQLVVQSAKPVIENSIRQEVVRSLPQTVKMCVEPLRRDVSLEVENLVAFGEAKLTSALTKSVCSRSFIDDLSTSVKASLSLNVQSACREAYNKVVVPGFNTISQQVFSQLNEAFTKGTKEYMQYVGTESQSTKAAILENVSATTRSLEKTSSTLSSHATLLMDSLHKGIAQQSTLTDSLGERLRPLIHEEVARALAEHQAAVEARAASRAQTPAAPAGGGGGGSHAPSPKVVRQQVQQLITQGQFNLAFKQALTASDLSLVVFVCERINPQQLFGTSPCPLSQDVLLSLISQLSHDLTTFTDLKIKYLEEAVVNLDTSHPVTKEHKKNVFQAFQKSLNSHLEVNPNHKKLKVLLLAVNHLASV